MKFDVIERDVVSSGAISTKDITLSANAKAFKIIFGQIYPDIVKAIVRELFTNAWDSQKMAGTLETPIDIHLPSVIEPWFSIRDYGLGMTTTIIDEVYSKVFESTKDGSNDEAGMFGMGSKTPLGYTDGFTVTSFVDGTLYAYDIFIGANGNPQISLNAMEATDEPNGVEVSVAVKQDDFEKFKDHAELFALHAGTPININRTRFLNQRKVFLTGDDWALYGANLNHDSGAFVRMGCVLYELDFSMILSNMSGYPSWEDRSRFTTITNLPLVLDFEIGDFDVTGSREDIVYTTKAAETIWERLEKSHAEILAQVDSKINESKSYREAYNYSIYLRDLDIITNKERADMKYGAMKLGRRDRYENRIINKHSMMHNAYSRNSSKIRSFSKSLELDTLMNDYNTTYIIIDDGKSKRAPARLENLLREVEKHNEVVRSCNYNSGKPKRFSSYLWIRDDNPQGALRRLATFLPKSYYIVNIADIEPLPYVRNPRVKKEVVDSCYRLRYYRTPSDIRTTSVHWDVEEDLHFVMLRDGRRLADHPTKIIDAAKILGVKLEDICAISPKKSNYIDEYNLTNLLIAAEEAKQAITYNDDTIYWHAMQDLRKDHDFRKYSYWMELWCKPEIGRLIGYSIDGDKVDRVNFVSDVNETVAKRYKEVYDGIRDSIISFNEKYPILDYVQSYYIKYNTTEIFNILGENE